MFQVLKTLQITTDHQLVLNIPACYDADPVEKKTLDFESTIYKEILHFGMVKILIKRLTSGNMFT